MTNIPSQYKVSGVEWDAEGYKALVPASLIRHLEIQHSPMSSPQMGFKQLTSVDEEEDEEFDFISSDEESSETGFNEDDEKSGNEDSKEV